MRVEEVNENGMDGMEGFDYRLLASGLTDEHSDQRWKLEHACIEYEATAEDVVAWRHLANAAEITPRQSVIDFRNCCVLFRRGRRTQPGFAVQCRRYRYHQRSSRLLIAVFVYGRYISPPACVC